MQCNQKESTGSMRTISIAHGFCIARATLPTVMCDLRTNATLDLHQVKFNTIFLFIYLTVSVTNAFLFIYLTVSVTNAHTHVRIILPVNRLYLSKFTGDRILIKLNLFKETAEFYRCAHKHSSVSMTCLLIFFCIVFADCAGGYQGFRSK